MTDELVELTLVEIQKFGEKKKLLALTNKDIDLLLDVHFETKQEYYGDLDRFAMDVLGTVYIPLKYFSKEENDAN